jgi:hypothetical protein
MPIGNGASMMKFPLSLTTGPAFILPIRRASPGLPLDRVAGEPILDRLVRTLAYAKAATSIGMPWVH